MVAKFSVGNRIRLQDGKTDMVVNRVLVLDDGTPGYVCAWEVNGVLGMETFAEAILVASPPPRRRGTFKARFG